MNEIAQPSRNRLAPPSFSDLLAVALPMIASQASETVMLFVDRLFLSRLGAVHIAASMSGGLSSFVFVSLFAGVVGYTNAIVAQYYGAGRNDHTVRTTVQGVWLAVMFFPLVLGLIPVGHGVFRFAGHGDSQLQLEFLYFRVLMWGGLFVMIRQAFVGFFLGIGRTRIVMIANVIGMIVNVPINYVLIFGHLGFPAMGIVGAAIGTIIGSAVILLFLAGAFLRHRYYRTTAGGARWRIDRSIMEKLVRFGAPAGLELFLNVFAFNLFIQLVHSLGPNVAAATTIVFNYDMVAFIPMIGLGIAVTSLVGRYMGAGDPAGARAATLLALRVGYVYALVMMAVFVGLPRTLISLFTGGLGTDAGAVMGLAIPMLRLAAVYTLADITQIVFGGALRGAGDTRMVAVISVSIHWVMAIAAFLFIRVIELPALQVWYFFVAFAVSLGIAIGLRFASGAWRSIRVIEEQPLPDLPPAPVEALEPEISTESHWM